MGGLLVMGWINLADANSARRASAPRVFRQLFDLRPMEQDKSTLGCELAVKRFKGCTLVVLPGSGGRPPAAAKSFSHRS